METMSYLISELYTLKPNQEMMLAAIEDDEVRVSMTSLRWKLDTRNGDHWSTLYLDTEAFDRLIDISILCGNLLIQQGCTDTLHLLH